MKINSLTLTMLLLSLLTLFSCVKPVHVSSIIREIDSVNVRVRDTVITVASESIIFNQGDLDSIKIILNQLKANGETPRIVYRSKENGPAKLQISLDREGKLVYDCGKDEQIISILITEIDRLKILIKENTVTVPEKQKWKTTLATIGIGAICFATGFLIGKLL